MKKSTQAENLGSRLSLIHKCLITQSLDQYKAYFIEYILLLTHSCRDCKLTRNSLMLHRGSNMLQNPMMAATSKITCTKVTEPSLTQILLYTILAVWFKSLPKRYLSPISLQLFSQGGSMGKEYTEFKGPLLFPCLLTYDASMLILEPKRMWHTIHRTAWV